MSSVWTRDLGSARVSIISEATGWWPIERAIVGVPEATWRSEIPTNAENQLPIGFNLVHVALPGASILVDTGFGEYDPTDRADPIVSVRGVQLTDGLDAALASLGVSREDVTHVLITHMHGDHIVGATRQVSVQRLPAFPNARYVVMEAEWNAAPEFHQNARAIDAQKEALLAARAVDLVPGDTEIVPGVDLIAAPGESPGHAIVRIAPDGQVVYCIGDLFHYPAEFSHFDWIPLYRDRATLVATRERLVPQFAEEDAWLIPAHHVFPAIGKVERTANGYRWREIESD
jgi:glyoxylase-like metal-dependent hydrolase (beta-lactamase superfamily II)